MSPGVDCLRRPSSVARTRLYGFVEPWLLATTFCTPITSNTARIGPPAITPVPSFAGARRTIDAPCLPCTSCCRVPFLSGTLNMLRRACSIAFWTATGTSFAFPLPIPTRPSPSPTTVSAAKPRIRPPFTTLVTRLMEIIFSRRPSLRSSCCCCCLPVGFAMFGSVSFVRALELQPALASGIGQRFDAAVVLESGAIEGDRLDASRLSLLRDAFADDGGRRAVATRLHVLAHVRLERRRAGEDLVARRRDDLRVNVAVRPRDHQAVRALLGNAHPRLAAAAGTSVLLVHRSILRFPATSSSFP